MDEDECERRVANVRHWMARYAADEQDYEALCSVGDVRALLSALDAAAQERDEARLSVETWIATEADVLRRRTCSTGPRLGLGESVRVMVIAPLESVARWEMAAEREGQDRSEWIRDSLDEAAERVGG